LIAFHIIRIGVTVLIFTIIMACHFLLAGSAMALLGLSRLLGGRRREKR
jgi:hypothetical protein